MQPSELSSKGEDWFSAVESGTSEYASAESNLEEPSAGMEVTEGTAMATTSTNNDDDDFFDAFVDADDGIKSAEDNGAFASGFSVAVGEVVEDNVGQASSSSSSVQPAAVDLFSIATTSESANQPASTHEEKPNSGINNNSHPEEEVDLFGAFNDTNIEQPDIGAYASIGEAQKNDDAVASSNIPADDDFFGAFGAVPPMTTESFTAPEKLGEKIIDEEDDNVNKIPDGSSNANFDATETLPANLTTGDYSDSIPSTQTKQESEISDGHEPASGDPSAVLPGSSYPPIAESVEGGDNNGGSVDFTQDNNAVIGLKNEVNGIHGESNGTVQNDAIVGGAVIASESLAGNDAENEPGVLSSGDDAQFHENCGGNSSSDIQGIISATESGINDDFGGFESPNEIESGDLLGAFALAGSGEDNLETVAQPLNSTLDCSVDNSETVSNPSGGNDAVVDMVEKNLESETSNEDPDADGKDFGEFSAFASEATGAPRDTPSALGLANGEVSEQYAAPHTSDNFGGFGSFEAVPPVAESTEYESSTQGDSFGGFASVDESPENPRASASKEASAVSQVENSDKDNANLSDGDAVADALESNLEVKGTVSKFTAVDSHVSGNDGDFGGFSSFEEKILPVTEPGKDGTVSPNVENEEDANFGGFNAFEESPANQPSAVIKSAGDDDSSSFEAFSTEAPGVDSLEAATAEVDDATGQPMAGVSDAADDEFGDFGDFDAVKDTPEEASPIDEPVESDRVMLNPAEEELPSGQPSAAVTSADDEFGGFDDFNAFEGTPDEASPDSAQIESDKRAPTPATEEAAAIQPFAAVSSIDDADDEFGDFGDFDAFEEATPDVANTLSDENESPRDEEEVPASQPSAVASPANDADDGFGGFGDFDAFEEAPEVQADTAEPESDQKLTIPAKEKTTEPPATLSPADGADDDFGEFGDFDAFEEASPDVAQTERDEKAPTPADEEATASQPSAVVSIANDAIDEFGDFGDFNAVEDTSEDVSPGDNAPTESERKTATPAEEKAPEPSASTGPADEDDFGDFGDFEEFENTPAKEAPLADAPPTESAKRDVPSVTESVPKPALSILNESVRVIFHGVFTSVTPSTSDSDGRGTCLELPFDIPMRKILPGPVSTEEKEASVPSHNQSERGLVLMKKHFQDLPRFPPITILSDEKWYPYSQYEFHPDGSPYADTVELATTPSVPEVLSIDLPTGFEATNLTPSPSSSKPRSGTPPPSSNRTTPTVVDFPSTPTNNVSTVVDLPSKRKNEEREIKSVIEVKQDSKKSEEMDHSQLSAIGKQFMQQLPDLSYMLKSTLSLPNGDK